MALSSHDLISNPIRHYPAATVACFDPTCGDLPRRHLDEPRTIAFIEHLAERRVPAVLIASSTGQGHLRTVDELETWLRCAMRTRLRDTLPMALLRPEDGMRANEHLLDLVTTLGYPVVFFRPGTDLDPSVGDEGVCRQLGPLIESAARRGLAIGLYSIPDVSGLSLTPEATARLITGPGGDHVVAVKITETDYDRSTARFLAHPALARLKIVQGWDPHLGRALRDGPRFDAHGRQRAGITSGMMSLAVDQYQHLLAAAERDDWAELEAALDAVATLFRSMQDDPQHFADLQRAKYVMGLGHPLNATVSEAQAEAILTGLAALPRAADRQRLARSLDLMGDGPFHTHLSAFYA